MNLKLDHGEKILWYNHYKHFSYTMGKIPFDITSWILQLCVRGKVQEQPVETKISPENSEEETPLGCTFSLSTFVLTAFLSFTLQYRKCELNYAKNPLPIQNANVYDVTK